MTAPHSPLFSAILGFLESEKWKFKVESIPEMESVKFDVRADNVEFVCNVAAFPPGRAFSFIAIVSAVTIPEDRRTLLCELITRINYQNFSAGFDFNVDEGKVLVRAAIDLVDVVPTAQFVRHAVFSAIDLGDKYFPAIMSVAFSTMTPTQALDDLKKKLETKK